jgi:outer membrane immunogenic protein
MKPISRFALAAALTFCAGSASAADLITMPVSSGAAEMPLADSDSGFDWTGFYAGVYGVAQNGSVSGLQYGAGLTAGVNAQIEFLLVGAEVALHGLIGGPAIDTAYGQVIGRAGVTITEDVLLYAAAGYGVDLGLPAEDDLLLGGGVEVAVADDLSLRAQYLRSLPISGGNTKDQVTFGANFHF